MISSFNAQVCLNSKSEAVCALIMLDGLVKSRPEKDTTVSATLSPSNSLLLHIGAEDIHLENMATEVLEILKEGKPLILKHAATGYEYSVMIE
jgi:hypothetical protein